MIRAGLIICVSFMIYATFNILLKIAAYDKEADSCIPEREKRVGEALCFGNGLVLGYLSFQMAPLLGRGRTDLSRNILDVFLLSVFAGCLLMACITDKRNCKVYNFTWWLGDAVGVFLLFSYIAENKKNLQGTVELLLPLLVFGMLQELFFCRMYGRADCHAFLACAIVESAYGMGMKEYLLHMLLAFGVLAVVQLLRHNIGRNGNLKRPIPFLPYITVSFWVILYVNTMRSVI